MNTKGDKTDALFEIGADGVDVEKIMTGIKDAVAQKMDRGEYQDVQIALAEKTNLTNLQDDESFLRFYLECLRNAVCVDINDFEICERRRAGGVLLVALKKTIWKLLKFYTYRLWSQQNEVNAMLVSAIEGIDEKYRNRIKDLESRLATLEGDKSCQKPDA